MDSHDRDKMGYWYYQNLQKTDLEKQQRLPVCSKCNVEIRPRTIFFPSILDTNGKILCKPCYDKIWKKQLERISIRKRKNSSPNKKE